MCNSILSLFGIEKWKDTLCLADFCRFWARKDNSLPCATLFSNFSTAKKLQKPFAAQTPPRKRGYVGDFAQNSNFYPSTAFPKVTALLLRCVHVTYGKIARRCSALLDNGLCTKSNYFGKSAIFYIFKQSTGHTFPTSLPTAR